jgi:hypothetical protein
MVQLINEFNLFEYSHLLCNCNGKDIMREAILNKIPLYKFISIDHDEKQIQQIYLGLKQRLDVSVYSNVKYSWLRMEAYREHIRLGHDIPTELLDEKLDFIKLLCLLEKDRKETVI